MKLFNLFNKKKPEAETKPASEPIKDEKSNIEIDFDTLVDNSRDGNLESLTKLYKAFLGLEKWCFIRSGETMEDSRPFIGIIDDKPWVFIFTDSSKAQQAKPNEDGSVVLIKMSVEGALEYIYKVGEQGAFGIRVNEGTHGWFCPIADLPNIIDYVNKN